MVEIRDGGWSVNLVWCFFQPGLTLFLSTWWTLWTFKYVIAFSTTLTWWSFKPSVIHILKKLFFYPFTSLGITICSVLYFKAPSPHPPLCFSICQCEFKNCAKPFSPPEKKSINKRPTETHTHTLTHIQRHTRSSKWSICPVEDIHHPLHPGAGYFCLLCLESSYIGSL